MRQEPPQARGVRARGHRPRDRADRDRVRRPESHRDRRGRLHAARSERGRRARRRRAIRTRSRRARRCRRHRIASSSRSSSRAPTSSASRALSDPRYLGRAQATLAPLVGRSPCRRPTCCCCARRSAQSLHDFPAARADLDQLIAVRPDDAQAHLTRAVVATVTADYAAARASCAALAPLVAPMIVGDVYRAARRRSPATSTTRSHARCSDRADLDPRPDPTLRGWAITALAELAIQRGDDAARPRRSAQALALDPDDAYARAALADVDAATGQPGRSLGAARRPETIDNLLVRRAIAEHRAHGPRCGAARRA